MWRKFDWNRLCRSCIESGKTPPGMKKPSRLLDWASLSIIASPIGDHFVAQHAQSHVSQTQGPSWQHRQPSSQAQPATLQQVLVLLADLPATVMPVAASKASVLEVVSEQPCEQAAFFATAPVAAFV